MALTRKFLKAMGIEDEKAEEIISAHVETVNGLKGERDDLQEQLEAAKPADPKPNEQGENPYKEQLEAEKKAFAEYKAHVEEEKAEEQKRGLYRELLAEAGVDQKRIDSVLKVSDLSKVTVKDGAIEGAEDLVNGIKSDWADFIPVTETKGASVAKPPAGGGGKAAPKTLRDALHERYEQKG